MYPLYWTVNEDSLSLPIGEQLIFPSALEIFKLVTGRSKQVVGETPDRLPSEDLPQLTFSSYTMRLSVIIESFSDGTCPFRVLKGLSETRWSTGCHGSQSPLPDIRTRHES
jgi:hypothetical protein